MADLIRVAVLTVSDRCSQADSVDESGPGIINSLPSETYVTALYAVVPDDKKQIANVLTRWCDDFSCDVILTTGGTGFSPKDVTPEATKKVIHQDAPNLAHFMLSEGLKRSPFAALSRAVAGVRGRTVIVNLPGSPTGAREGTAALLALLPHLVDVLRQQEVSHPSF